MPSSYVIAEHFEQFIKGQLQLDNSLTGNPGDFRPAGANEQGSCRETALGYIA